MESPADYTAANITPTLAKGLAALCHARPSNPVEWLGEWLLENKPTKPIALASEKYQSAFVFAKPHANTSAVLEMIAEKFAEQGIEVLTEGEIDGPTIDAEKLIDQHYYAIASKATITTASQLPVPAAKFAETFGEDWSTVCADGRCFNSLEMCKHLGIDAVELNKRWKATTNLVKFGGGFYCASIVDGDKTLYVFNAFFMSMRGKFTAPGSAIHYYVVQFDPAKLSWADFRGAVLGPTDPAKAPDTSLRGMMYARWQSLGLEGAPNTTDNGVHASASPFEGLAERLNWMKATIADDAFGKKMLDAGISEETIKKWSVDPRVPMPDGSSGSIFDALEDLDLADCIAKAVEINSA